MKRWILPLVSLPAIAGVVAFALFLAGLFDSDDASGIGDGGPEASALCAEDTPDCEDTLVVDGTADYESEDDGGDTVAPGCEVGHVGNCSDTPITDGEDGDAVSIDPMCAEGVSDCEDTVAIDSDGPVADPFVPVGGECSADALEGCIQRAITAALLDAERQFGVDESAIIVESTASQVWSDTCLGAASEGEACGDAITPGFVIVIEVEGTQYEYHTDLNGNVRLAL